LVFTDVDFYLVGADVERDGFESEIEKFQMTFSVWKEGGLFALRELLVVEVVHVLQEVDNEFRIFVSYLVLRMFLLIFDDRSCQQMLTLDHQWSKWIKNSYIIQQIAECCQTDLQ